MSICMLSLAGCPLEECGSDEEEPPANLPDGAACHNTYECAGFCVEFDGVSQCTSYCGSDDDCASGMCAEATDGGRYCVPPSSSGSSGSGSGMCDQIDAQCGNNPQPEQRCLYCQAACLCLASGDQACADQNNASACQLGTNACCW